MTRRDIAGTVMNLLSDFDGEANCTGHHWQRILAFLRHPRHRNIVTRQRSAQRYFPMELLANAT